MIVCNYYVERNTPLDNHGKWLRRIDFFFCAHLFSSSFSLISFLIRLVFAEEALPKPNQFPPTITRKYIGKGISHRFNSNQEFEYWIVMINVWLICCELSARGEIAKNEPAFPDRPWFPWISGFFFRRVIQDIALFRLFVRARFVCLNTIKLIEHYIFPSLI